MKSTTSVST